mgnify:CR=1 FL=1
MKKLLGFLLGFILIASTTFSGSMTSVTNPGGADTQVQFNNAGAFGGDADMSFTGGNTLNVDYINLPAPTSTEGVITVNTFKAFHVDTATNNIFLGRTAGNFTLSGSNNIAMGINSGSQLTSGNQNVLIGNFGAANTLSSGAQNVFLGFYSGGNVDTGSNNVFLGYFAGRGAGGNVSNRLHIDSGNDATSLIYGELDNDRLCIDCVNPTAKLHLPAGIATAGYAPLKLTSGTNLTTPEAGAIEYNGTELFFSPSTVRHTVVKSAAASATPTVTGFGTSPSVVTSNGTHAFTINVGTGGTASTGTITLPTATTAWVCNMWDVTNPDSFNTKMTGGTATTVTVTNYSMTTGNAIAWTASDILRVSCIAY